MFALLQQLQQQRKVLCNVGCTCEQLPFVHEVLTTSSYCAGLLCTIPKHHLICAGCFFCKENRICLNRVCLHKTATNRQTLLLDTLLLLATPPIPPPARGFCCTLRSKRRQPQLMLGDRVSSAAYVSPMCHVASIHQLSALLATLRCAHPAGAKGRMTREGRQRARLGPRYCVFEAMLSSTQHPHCLAW